MSGELYVDLTVLEGTERDLGRVADNLSECASRLRGASRGDLGSPRLDEACADFRDTWAYGTEKLGEAADMVRKQLGEGLKVYVESDSKLASVLRS